MKKEDLTAIVLSGGRSSRMGRDKGLMPLGASTLAGRALKTASQVAGAVMLIANKGGYEDFGYPVYADLYPQNGPAGGIHSGLVHSTTEQNLVLACDMPLLSVPLLKHLSEQVNGDHEITAPVHLGEVQPLCAFYVRHLVQFLEEFIRSGKRRLNDLLRERKTRYVPIDSSLPFYAPGLFTNVNTTVDLAAVESTDAAKVKVLFFGRLAEITRRRELELQLQVPGTLDRLTDVLAGRFPALKNEVFTVAINQAIAATGASLREGDEVALLPPYAGG